MLITEVVTVKDSLTKQDKDKVLEVPLTRTFEPLPSGLGRWTFTCPADRAETERKRFVDGVPLKAEWKTPRIFTLAGCTFKLEADKDKGEAERVVPASLHEGFALVPTWTGANTFTLEGKKVVAAAPDPKEPTHPPAAVDPLDQMSDADLKTLMGEKGVKYNPKKFDRFKGIEDLRAKLAGKTPEPQPA